MHLRQFGVTCQVVLLAEQGTHPSLVCDGLVDAAVYATAFMQESRLQHGLGAEELVHPILLELTKECHTLEWTLG